MRWSVLQVGAVLLISAPASSAADQERQKVPANYAYQYQVRDKHYGIYFAAGESRKIDSTKGSYNVQLPDGRVQTVIYTVKDPSSGYLADVTYKGDEAIQRVEYEPQVQRKPAPYARDQAATVDSDAVPKKSNAVPKKSNAIPNDSNVVPNESNVVTVESNDVPVESNAGPVESNAVPVESKAIPGESNAAPVEPNAIPVESNAVELREESDQKPSELVLDKEVEVIDDGNGIEAIVNELEDIDNFVDLKIPQEIEQDSAPTEISETLTLAPKGAGVSQSFEQIQDRSSDAIPKDQAWASDYQYTPQPQQYFQGDLFSLPSTRVYGHNSWGYSSANAGWAADTSAGINWAADQGTGAAAQNQYQTNNGYNYPQTYFSVFKARSTTKKPQYSPPRGYLPPVSSSYALKPAKNQYSNQYSFAPPVPPKAEFSVNEIIKEAPKDIDLDVQSDAVVFPVEAYTETTIEPLPSPETPVATSEDSLTDNVDLRTNLDPASSTTETLAPVGQANPIEEVPSTSAGPTEDIAQKDDSLIDTIDTIDENNPEADITTESSTRETLEEDLTVLEVTAPTVEETTPGLTNENEISTRSPKILSDDFVPLFDFDATTQEISETTTSSSSERITTAQEFIDLEANFDDGTELTTMVINLPETTLSSLNNEDVLTADIFLESKNQLTTTEGTVSDVETTLSPQNNVLLASTTEITLSSIEPTSAEADAQSQTPSAEKTNITIDLTSNQSSKARIFFRPRTANPNFADPVDISDSAKPVKDESLLNDTTDPSQLPILPDSSAENEIIDLSVSQVGRQPKKLPASEDSNNDIAPADVAAKPSPSSTQKYFISYKSVTPASVQTYGSPEPAPSYVPSSTTPATTTTTAPEYTTSKATAAPVYQYFQTYDAPAPAPEYVPSSTTPARTATSAPKYVTSKATAAPVYQYFQTYDAPAPAPAYEPSYTTPTTTQAPRYIASQAPTVPAFQYVPSYDIPEPAPVYVPTYTTSTTPNTPTPKYIPAVPVSQYIQSYDLPAPAPAYVPPKSTSPPKYVVSSYDAPASEVIATYESPSPIPTKYIVSKPVEYLPSYATAYSAPPTPAPTQAPIPVYIPSSSYQPTNTPVLQPLPTYKPTVHITPTEVAPIPSYQTAHSKFKPIQTAPSYSVSAPASYQTRKPAYSKPTYPRKKPVYPSRPKYTTRPTSPTQYRPRPRPQKPRTQPGRPKPHHPLGFLNPANYFKTPSVMYGGWRPTA